MVTGLETGRSFYIFFINTIAIFIVSYFFPVEHSTTKSSSSSSSTSSTSSRTNVRERSGRKGDHKPTRIRTVLNEKQLHTLRSCYNANPRPDALMKEQLTEMTNLSPRVIRVWFQNKRCKDKKRSIAMKQMQGAAV